MQTWPYFYIISTNKIPLSIKIQPESDGPWNTRNEHYEKDTSDRHLWIYRVVLRKRTASGGVCRARNRAQSGQGARGARNPCRRSVDTTNLSIVGLDLASDRGWDDAVAGCDFVMHVASPFVIANPKNPLEMISPAVDGTLRALRAAKNAGIGRVVLTSSILSMMGSMKTGTFGPSDWTDVTAPDISTYTKSKTLVYRFRRAI